MYSCRTQSKCYDIHYTVLANEGWALVYCWRVMAGVLTGWIAEGL